MVRSRRETARRAMGCAAKSIIEALERRQLLAVSVNAAAGAIAKAGGLAPLLEDYQNYVAAHGNANGFVARQRTLRVNGDGVAVEVFTSDGISPKTLQTKLNGRGVRNTQRFEAGVYGIVPLNEINSIVKLPDVAWIRPVRPITHVGSVTSQGDPAIR